MFSGMNSMGGDIISRYTKGEVSSQEYWEHCLTEIQPLLNNIARGCPKLQVDVVENLTWCFREMDALDREHPFWINTNKFATRYKLSEYARFRYEETKGDWRYAKVLVFEEMIWSPQILLPEYLGPILKQGKIDLETIVRVAWNTSPYWFDANIVKLAETAQVLGIVEDVREALKVIAKLRSKSARKWKKAVERYFDSFVS